MGVSGKSGPWPHHGPDITTRPPTVKEKCSTIKRNGERCGNWPIRGGTVCMYHGGAAPQVRAAANRRLQRAQMDVDTGQLLTELEVDAADRGPTELLLDAVYRTHAMVQVIGAALGGVAVTEFRVGRDGVDRPNVLTEMYGVWVERAAKAAKLALDAGVAERLVRVEQDKGQLLAGVIRAVLDDPELGLTPEQRAAAGPVAGRHLRAIAGG